MGDYLATYTEEYPASDGSVDAGYSLTLSAGAVYGSVVGSTRVPNSLLEEPEDTLLWRKTALSVTPLTFVKNGSTWTAATEIPETYDRLVGGGYANGVSATELDELVTAGLLTSAQRDEVTSELT